MPHLPNREIRLLRAPGARPAAADFVAVDAALPLLAAGEVLVEVRWLAIEPWQHERLRGDRIGPRLAPGQRMVGRGVGRVLDGALPRGTLVAGELGWQRYAVVSAEAVAPLPDIAVRETLHLSVLGVPGLTAWLALFASARASAGETVLVTSAAGTVGAIAGQLARRAGLRAVGVASARKCAMLAALGYDAAVDRGAADLPAAIAGACGPRGFDVLVDLAGGRILEACLVAAGTRARVVLCGHVAAYDDGPARLDADRLLYGRLEVTGFLVHDHAARFAAARAALATAALAGLDVPETIHRGLDAAPAVLAALLAGEGQGRHLVAVAADGHAHDT